MMNTGIYHKSQLTRADMRNFVFHTADWRLSVILYGAC